MEEMPIKGAQPNLCAPPTSFHPIIIKKGRCKTKKNQTLSLPFHSSNSSPSTPQVPITYPFRGSLPPSPLARRLCSPSLAVVAHPRFLRRFVRWRSPISSVCGSCSPSLAAVDHPPLLRWPQRPVKRRAPAAHHHIRRLIPPSSRRQRASAA